MDPPHNESVPPALAAALASVERWPCGHAAVATTGAAVASHGDPDARFPWASVTKLATALAVLVAAEEGVVDLDEPAGPPGSTLRHLLAHASGLPLDGDTPLSRPGRRRIYSNSGFEAAAALVASSARMPFAQYFHEVWAGTAIRLEGPPSSGATGRLVDLVALADELLVPARVAAETLSEAVRVQFPGLDGVLPGYGRLAPNDWGLGLELRDSKARHWTGAANSTSTFGHFGRSGTFLWVDPAAGLALACLTDQPFGEWAVEAWPRLSDAVLAAVAP
jgi:CubicO group peptidase (beta-lactamase class C family)